MDWVQNDYCYGTNQSVATGPAAAVAVPLTVPAMGNYALVQAPSAGYTANDFAPAVWSPQDKGMTVLAVRGQIVIYPSGWALGNNLQVGMRIIEAEIDPASWGANLDADYTMWLMSAGDAQRPAVWADDPFLWERRFQTGFNDSATDPRFTVNVNVKSKRRLDNDKALFLYLEVGADSVTTRITPWLRTLVTGF